MTTPSHPMPHKSTTVARRGSPSDLYEYDVFLSYRRANAWPRFVDTIFLPMLRHWLEAEMGEPPRIFFDVDEIETGESWPYRLARGVALSKVMVCLWSNEYFHSPWCEAELSHMLARVETIGDRPPLPLILAVVIHDGERVSADLSYIQALPIQEYANPWLAPGSPNAEALSRLIRRFAAHIYRAIRLAPACDPNWSDLAIDKFRSLFEQHDLHSALPSFARETP